MLLSAFLLALPTAVSISEPPPPTLAEREAEWRRLTDVEPTPLIADLNLGLGLPNVPERYRGRLRYEGIAASAGRDLEWIEGVAVMRVPDLTAQLREERRRTIAEWLKGLSPAERGRLRRGEAFVGELPEGPRRAVLARLPAVPADLLGARIQIEAAYNVVYRASDGVLVSATSPVVSSDGVVVPPREGGPRFSPPVDPLPPRTDGPLRFPEGRVLTVRQLVDEAVRAFDRWAPVDERIADRTLFMRGSFTPESLARALAPLVGVEPLRWTGPGDPPTGPDFVGGALSALWKDAPLPPGVTLEMLRQGFETEIARAASFSPSLSRVMARDPAGGRARVRGSILFTVDIPAFTRYQFGAE